MNQELGTTAGNAIYLDRNENNYGPAPACYDVLAGADLTRLSWYDRSFTHGSRGILSERLAREFALGEDRIVLGYGAEHILKQTVQCYLGKGSTLMVPALSWWYYKKIASEVGARSVEFPMRSGEDSFLYDPGAMREVYARDRPAVVFISSPNNPTGNSLDAPALSSLVGDFSESVVVLDEAYVFGGETARATEIVEAHPNLLVVRTMSKYYALAGVRIGFALRGRGLDRLAAFSNRYLGYNRLSEELAIAALDSPAYYAGIAAKMTADKERYYRALGNLPGFRVFRSDANFILAEIDPARKAALKTHLESRGLFIKFMDEPLLNSHVRITIGTVEENSRLIAAITSFFD
ncbi:MAG TPA: histidinol-phosphate transaminase [Bacteroidota bacterium]|nr:histidinol-phosphate transaminase [Bacteroidota bacterium]